jgi:uroporphyrinogen decarboxylase
MVQEKDVRQMKDSAMAALSSEERVRRVLTHGEPDRVPHFEWIVDRKVRTALVPGCASHNEFAVKMDHDAVLVEVSFRKERVLPDKWKTEWGYVLQDSEEEHGVEVQSPISSMADFERYVPPDPREPWRYKAVEDAVRDFSGKKAVIAHLNDVFSLPRYLLGYETLLMAIAAEPDLVTALVDLSVTTNLAMAKELAARGVKIVYTGDDYAGDTGPLMSPAHFRDLFAPGLKRVIGGFKELGLLVIKHTDGNLWPIIDSIVDSGIDCLDPIDPIAGMDLGEVKARFGKRIALKGNVDCSHLMTLGSPAEVVEATKAALRAGAPGGGYILSSSNSIHSSVKPENYLAMMRTLKEFGTYPLRI